MRFYLTTKKMTTKATESCEMESLQEQFCNIKLVDSSSRSQDYPLDSNANRQKSKQQACNVFSFTCQIHRESKQAPTSIVPEETVLRKRGPDKLSVQQLHETNKHAPYTKLVGPPSGHVWLSTPRNSVRSNTFLDSASSDLNEKAEIEKLVEYLRSSEKESGTDQNKSSVFAHIVEQYSEPCKETYSFSTDDQVLESLLEVQSPQKVSSPIPVPRKICSPLNSTSCHSPDNGYTSDFSDSSPKFFEESLNMSVVVTTTAQQIAVLQDPNINCSNKGSSIMIINKVVDKLSLPANPPPLPVKTVAKGCKKKKNRNPFFVGLDHNYCESCRKKISNIEKKEGLDKKDKNGKTRLHMAIADGDYAYAIVFINKIEKQFETNKKSRGLESFPDLQSFLDQPDASGYTPLLLACVSNLSNVVKYLLKCGASLVLNEGKEYYSVFHYVCERGQRFYDVVKVLCECLHSKKCVAMRNFKGETPLHVAVTFHNGTHTDQNAEISEIVNNREIMTLLLQNEAKLSAQDQLGQTALHKAVISSKPLELLDCLYTNAFTEDWRRSINLQDYNGRTVLHTAVQSRNPNLNKIIEYLMARNASPLIRDITGKLPSEYIPEDRQDLCQCLNTGYYELNSLTGVQI